MGKRHLLYESPCLAHSRTSIDACCLGLQGLAGNTKLATAPLLAFGRGDKDPKTSSGKP